MTPVSTLVPPSVERCSLPGEPYFAARQHPGFAPVRQHRGQHSSFGNSVFHLRRPSSATQHEGKFA